MCSSLANFLVYILQLTLFANLSQKLDLAEHILPDTFLTTHLGSVISLFTEVVWETAIVFLLLSYARKNVKQVR